MNPEKIEYGYSTGCFISSSKEIAIKTVLQQREIRESFLRFGRIKREAERRFGEEIGLGVEVFHRRRLTSEELEEKARILTYHAPLYFNLRSPVFTKVDPPFESWLLWIMSGFFDSQPAPQIAQELNVPLIVHTGIIKALEAEGKIPEKANWLVETEKRPRKATQEIVFHPQEVVELAANNNFNLVFDTSRTLLAGFPLREAWETYISKGVEKVKVIHFSGVQEKQGRLVGGQVVHEKFLEQHRLGEMKEFIQQLGKDGWEGTIIIEHAPQTTPKGTYKDKEDQILYTLATLLFLPTSR